MERSASTEPSYRTGRPTDRLTNHPFPSPSPSPSRRLNAGCRLFPYVGPLVSRPDVWSRCLAQSRLATRSDARFNFLFPPTCRFSSLIQHPRPAWDAVSPSPPLFLSLVSEGDPATASPGWSRFVRFITSRRCDKFGKTSRARRDRSTNDR